MRPLATQLVGSYSKPAWLIDASRFPFQGEDDGWRPDPALRRQAQDDATLLAIGDQERAGLDILTDGEERRGRFDMYCLRFDGIDTQTLATRRVPIPRDTSGSDFRPRFAGTADPTRGLSPRVTGPVRWTTPISVDDLIFLRAHTRRPVKTTFIGPLTAACRLADEHYDDFGALVMDLAAAINSELRALEAAGADLIQIDEPDLFLRRSATEPIAIAAIDRTLAGLKVPTIVHVCHGYPVTAMNKRTSTGYLDILALIASTTATGISLEWEEPGYDAAMLTACGTKTVVLGTLNLGNHAIESADHLIRRIDSALAVVPPARLSLAPDCGLWHLPRDVAYVKLRAMCYAAETIRLRL